MCIAIAWFAGGFINGVAGFGAAMIAMPLAAPFMEIPIAVPACTLIVLILNCQVGWTFRKDIQWRYVKGICIGTIPGIVFSVFALEHMSETHLKAGMGLFIAAYALFNLLWDNKNKRPVNPAWGYLAGLLSSTLGMAFGFNGPPLAVYMAYSGCPARAVKGMLGAGFIITGLFIVGAKAATGQINQMVLLTFLLSTPAVIIGSKLGIRLSSNLNEIVYRKILFLSLVGMGLRIAWVALI